MRAAGAADFMGITRLSAGALSDMSLSAPAESRVMPTKSAAPVLLESLSAVQHRRETRGVMSLVGRRRSTTVGKALWLVAVTNRDTPLLRCS